MPGTKPIRVLVVDDSAFMRKMLSDMINSSVGFKVVGQARDGQDALTKIAELKPDVVTMDIEMPKMDGLLALQNIMKKNPVPVVMLSSLTTYGAEQTVRALEMGAVDFIPKPSGQISLDINRIQDEMISKLRVAAQAGDQVNSPMHFDEPEQKYPKTSSSNEKPKADRKDELEKLVVIGTSTGGPKALHNVIPLLPASIDAAILIVQHMPPGFTKSLAERLNSLSSIMVKEAEHGEKIIPGCAYIAPGDSHMKVRSSHSKNELYIVLDQSSPRGGHRPSVDVMFESVSENFRSTTVAVVMTGMGCDGASGIRKIKANNGMIIAEHQSSCIVYGMPRAAIETGTVDKIVPLNRIAETIMSFVQA